MSKRRTNKTAVDLGLESLEDPQDQGVSLERLTDTYSRMLNDGDVPYEADEAPADTLRQDGLTETRQVHPLDAGTAMADDRDPDAACAISPTSIVEAILFVGHPQNESITARQMASLMRGVRSSEIDLLVQELNEHYASAGCPFQIESAAGGYRLVLLGRFDALRENFYGRIREAKLSQAAIEALATIAYHQPLNRAALQEKCDAAQRRAVPQLVRRGLVSVQHGASGREATSYQTTDRFLEMFGLDSLDDLPQPHFIDQF